MEKELKIIAEAGRQEIFIEREFDAPRELVFKAFTDPAIVVQFLGPDRLTMRIEKWDMRSGGSYRYVHFDESKPGIEYGFHGSVHEVHAPELIIQTFEFEGLPEKGHVSLDFLRLHPLPGNRTRLVIHSILPSVADRDGMVQSGMETGIKEGYARLDKILAKGL